MKSYKLNNTLEIPKLGFGTYKAQEDEGLAAVESALKEGYRLIDTAAYYFNEEIVGKAIRYSDIPREEIIVTTKLWREQLGYENAKAAFANSLARLGLDYIDIYLIHWPANAKNYADWKQTNAETWRAMENLVAEGKIKTIGVSNFTLPYLQPLLEEANIKPALNQIEFHPGYWQPKVYQFCMDHDILIEAWSPLARGRVLDQDLIRSLGQKYHKSEAQICLRWCLDKGVIPIPKSSTPKRIVENMDIFDFKLTDEEVKSVDQIPKTGFSGELPDLWPDRLS